MLTPEGFFLLWFQYLYDFFHFSIFIIQPISYYSGSLRYANFQNIVFQHLNKTAAPNSYFAPEPSSACWLTLKLLYPSAYLHM